MKNLQSDTIENNQVPVSKEIHLRIWSNNKFDIDTACGLFSRTYSKNRHWKYTYLANEVTCLKCLKFIGG